MRNTEIPICPICGSTMPADKKICWCCEHEPKLGLNKEKNCGKDSCEIKFKEE